MYLQIRVPQHLKKNPNQQTQIEYIVKSVHEKGFHTSRETAGTQTVKPFW